MTASPAPWRHLPHGAIEPLAPGLWCVSGTLPGGNPLPRNMVVYQLADGGLLIHSAVNLDPDGMQALEALGTPRVLVVPNRFHRMDAPAWKARYPEIRVVGPAAVRAIIEKVVPLDATSEEALPPLGIRLHVPDGAKPDEHWLELPLAGDRHALVCTDLLFNCREHFPGVGGFVMRHLTGSTGHFGTTRLSRMMLVRDQRALAGWLRAQADRPGLAAVVVGHGTPIVDDVAAELRAAADQG
ncbi:MAG: hypothetical protein H6742_11755 [Alphaproteobacteria bacterium]|nr:hypothetical protein [Alphaproteobacteria bacterium]